MLVTTPFCVEKAEWWRCCLRAGSRLEWDTLCCSLFLHLLAGPQACLCRVGAVPIARHRSVFEAEERCRCSSGGEESDADDVSFAWADRKNHHGARRDAGGEAEQYDGANDAITVLHTTSFVERHMLPNCMRRVNQRA